MQFFGSKTTAVALTTMKIQKFQSIEKISLDSFGGGSEIFLLREGYPQFPFFLSGFYSLNLCVPHNFQKPIPQS